LALSRSAVIATDPDGYITEWGGAAETIFGYGATEMHGHHLLELFADETDFEIALGGGIDPRGGAVTVRHRRKDGTLVWVQLQLVPEHDECGERTGLLAQAVDVQSSVAEIEQMRVRSRTFDIVPLPIAIAGADRVVLSANAAWRHCFGAAAEHVLGRVCPLLEEPDASAGDFTARNAVLRATGQWSGTFDHAIDDLHRLRMDVTISVVMGELGRVAGFLVLVTAVQRRGGLGEVRAPSVALIDE
jgi:PAS domain S-box-containing protein